MDAILLDAIEYNGGGINTLLKNALLNAGSVVKSKQEGMIFEMSIPYNVTNETKDFLITNIGNVNSQKCILNSVFREGNRTNSSGRVMRWSYPIIKDDGLYLRISSLEDMNFSGSMDINGLYWSVIEFY